MRKCKILSDKKKTPQEDKIRRNVQLITLKFPELTRQDHKKMRNPADVVRGWSTDDNYL